MSKDNLDLKQYIRNVKNFPIDGIEFKDITSLIETPHAFIKTCDELTRVTKEFGANMVASIESRGFIFAGTIARDLHLPFVLARKPGKLPNETFQKSFDLEYGSTSIEIQKNTKVGGNQKIVIDFTEIYFLIEPIPPSMFITCPVTQLLSSLSK